MNIDEFKKQIPDETSWRIFLLENVLCDPPNDVQLS